MALVTIDLTVPEIYRDKDLIIHLHQATIEIWRLDMLSLIFFVFI